MREQPVSIARRSKLTSARKHGRVLGTSVLDISRELAAEIVIGERSGRTSDSATLIWTHLPAKVGPTRRPSGLLNREGQWTGEPKWNFSKRSGESTSLEPERCVR